MTTPSSSTTTPSPQLRYMQSGAAIPPQTVATNGIETSDREDRERAVQKFLARAELSKLTRGLRTRLTYATYKATHNLAHTTLHDLEAKTENQPTLYRTPSGRNNNYYNNPATQGNSAMIPASTSRTTPRKGTMAPPPPVTASATQSLFASILAPPPAKRARTIHNPQDPPVPPPAKPKPASPPKKTPKGKGAAANAQQKPKTRKDDKGKRKESGGRAINRVPSTSSQNVMVDEEMDIKAATALTSLLRSRPSMSAATSSPRSSISATSDPGSLHSFPHYAQSSARTTTAPASGLSSNEHSFTMPYGRSTPPPMSQMQSHVRDSDMRFHGNSTPKPQGRPQRRPGEPSTPQAPSDTEAADLMLFLATSPSPARLSTARDKEAKNMGSFRSLSGNNALQGRVLFSGGDDRQGPGPRPLRRDYTGSFSSTLTVATEPTSEAGYHAGTSEDSIMRSPSPPSKPPGQQHDEPMHLDIPQMPTITPPTPTDQPPQHMPAPPPTSTSAEINTVQIDPSSSTQVASSADQRLSMPAPPTPGFSYHDFLNVSPSPAVALGSASRLTGRNSEIGRRLFEEHSAVPGNSRDGMAGHSSPLGAGIDLVKS
ncbi:unnamed protein product [Somion occarium]|uniref:Uncharacterized protein n=1 Tax=Somion occarium TaxID=3059160 RepID=A0ABP1ED97_9APHY